MPRPPKRCEALFTPQIRRESKVSLKLVKIVNKKEIRDEVRKLRKEALPHLRAINKAVEKVTKLLKDDDWAFDYIHNGGDLEKIMSMITAYEKKDWKKAKKILEKMTR